jgi:peptide deformylase
MAVLNIVIWPAKVLDEPAKAITEITHMHHQLASDLVDTCEQVGGLGLAAPQVGVGLSMFVLNTKAIDPSLDGYETFINPKAVKTGGEQTKQEEGCLSFPGVRAKIKRHKTFGIEYTTLNGTTETLSGDGLLAQALQHELDHLLGKPFIEHMSSIKRRSAKQKMKILKRRMIAEGVTYHDVIGSRDE